MTMRGDVPATPVAAHVPVISGGNSLVTVSTPAANGRGPTVHAITRHPELRGGRGELVPVVYRDVNTTRPNFFRPRIDETDVRLHEEHSEALRAVNHAQVANSVAANERWTAEMRTAHKRCFEAIELERTGTVAPPVFRHLAPPPAALALAEQPLPFPMPMPPASVGSAPIVHAHSVHTLEVAKAVHDSFL
ncbi:hypothetical protein DIPPA_25109 [Diplonema papillatum]|nr:hypothetical protein DIPPA_15405 [Diplonema papillatum]KAJ9437475.1 hypothetical protein DIPPA_25109 [Diplonema papillatum]